MTFSTTRAKVAEGELPHAIPIKISIGEGFDISEDVGSAADFTYQPPLPAASKR